MGKRRYEIPPIEQGIPMPRAITSRRRWDFESMNPGDSFFDTAAVNTVMNAARAWRKRNNPAIRFSYRNVVEDGKKGIRVWRVA